MTPVIPRSSSPISLVPGATFTARKNSSLRRCCFLKNSSIRTSYAQDFILPLSASVRLFPHIRTCDLHRKPLLKMVSASGVDVAVEQPDSSAADQGSTVPVDVGSNVQSKEDASKSKHARPGRKSEMPPVKNENLVSGATFTGKVRSIHPFGAFVDFGAFSDGLVHVSQLSDNFVRDVGDVVSVGQEVQVRLLKADTETGRISLTMRTSDSMGTADRGTADRGTADRDRKGPPRRNTQNSNQKRDGQGKKTTSMFEEGQKLEGTVKNFTRSGAFISLPDGEEGFLPRSEEDNEGIGSVMGETSLEIGQQVSVRVLRVTRGQATLTMKEEETSMSSDLEIEVGDVHVAASPFLLAFRKNKEISAYLDARAKEKENTESLKTVESAVQTAEEEPVATSNILSPEESVTSVDQVTETAIGTPEVVELKSDGQSVVTSDILSPGESVSSVDQVAETAIGTPEVVEVKSDGQIDEPIIDEVKIETPISEAAISFPPPVEIENATADSDESSNITNEVPMEVPGDESESSSPTPIEDAKVEPNSVEDGSITSEGQIQTPDADKNSIISSSHESASEETPVVDQIDDVPPKDEVQIETPKLDVAQVEDKNLVPTSEKDISVTDSNGQAGVPSPKETTVKATISPALVKQLREETGAGMMDCKRALSESEGDIIKAQEYLRKKGLASADKKASRATAEGRIGSYIHDSRIGVLIEVNCETDFVSRGDIFKELVDDLAMQVAACPQVKYLATDDVPQTTIDKEREIEMQKEDLALKPEQIRSKIVDGRINKRLEELALLEQPYIKNDKVVVKDFVKQTIATVGENMKVKRFVRFNLGEGLEKKSQDFAAEVAAQATVKSAPAPVIDQPIAVEVKESDDKPPKAAISAALVKQLREETGAGMMDCKKALSETGGDLEKAQEFLRKKGLSTADKKSSRIAAEGRIGSYIHDSRIGVLIEVNCETDFVGRSEKFKGLVDDLAMQVAAYPKVEYVSVEDIPENIVTKEKELEMQREDILSKPENIREKIVDGRVSKRLGELALLEQPFIKDDSVLVKDIVKQAVAAIGENIKVRRFVRFTLGEAADAKTETEV